MKDTRSTAVLPEWDIATGQGREAMRRWLYKELEDEEAFNFEVMGDHSWSVVGETWEDYQREQLFGRWDALSRKEKSAFKRELESKMMSDPSRMLLVEREWLFKQTRRQSKPRERKKGVRERCIVPRQRVLLVVEDTDRILKLWRLHYGENYNVVMDAVTFAAERWEEHPDRQFDLITAVLNFRNLSKDLKKKRSKKRS